MKYKMSYKKDSDKMLNICMESFSKLITDSKKEDENNMAREKNHIRSTVALIYTGSIFK